MKPPVPDTQNTAVFLDFDGTLVDFAQTPDAVAVSSELKLLLKGLNSKLEGAVALVTGRSLESLDTLVDNPSLLAAGCHGAEWRLLAGRCESVSHELGPLDAVRSSLAGLVSEHDLHLEDKLYSLALHFRDKPELEATVDAWLADKVFAIDGIRVINGKLVREIQLAGIDKGIAVERFMQHAPFFGRVPLYIGDDRTDEDAFKWVNQAGGVSIKVGEGETIAAYRLANYRAVLEWLNHLLAG